jgi:hypothetical protein
MALMPHPAAPGARITTAAMAVAREFKGIIVVS